MTLGRRTVASNDKELVVAVDLVDLDVREGSDDLLLRGKIGALLEFEVAYRTGQGEVAVDTAKVDEASCGLDTCLLGCGWSAQSSHLVLALLTLVLGLVIEGKGLCAAFDAQDCARVTRVCLLLVSMLMSALRLRPLTT